MLQRRRVRTKPTAAERRFAMLRSACNPRQHPGIRNAVANEHDPRVAPWQVAKFEARIQAASTSNNPVVLRVDEHPGHGIGDSADVRYAELADVFALLLHEEGVRPRAHGARTP